MATAGERAAAAEVLGKARARTSRVRLLLDGELSDQLDAVRSDFEAAAPESDEARATAERLVALEDEAEKEKTLFVFQVGRGRWRKLIADHPPSEEHKALGAEFDPVEFPFVAMAEFLIEPKLTVDDLRSLEEDVLDEVQFNVLWGTCLKAAVGSGARDPSLAARQLLNACGSSKPASDSE